jgi:hypothetical protein
MTLIEDQFEDTLAIVRRAGGELAIAVGDHGDMPRIRTAGHHPADVTRIHTAVSDQLGLETMVLDCLSLSVADGVVHRILSLELLDAGSATANLSWIAPTDLRRSISGEPFDSLVLDNWFAELAEQRRPPDGRAWTVPGWRARAAAWIADTVQAARLGRVLALEQLREWEFSCVLRVRTDQEDLYFKALPRSYAREPRLAQLLADRQSGFVPGVVATSQPERWLLTRACHGHSLEEGAPLRAWERAAAAYAELQVASTALAQALAALGCPLRGPLELRALVGPLLADEMAMLVGQPEHGLTTEEFSRLRMLRPSLEAACDELADCGLPLALEHGDLWSSNVYVGDNAVQFIDWTDASISHPFFSLMPFLLSAQWDLDPAAVPVVEARIVDQYLERWLPFAPRERLRRALAIARPLAALHIAVTYWRDIPQPHKQWWIPRMVPFFSRIALKQWDALE